MKCNQCGSAEATQLLNTILCVKKECQNYDEKWAIEQGYIELEDIELPSDPNSFKIDLQVISTNPFINYTWLVNTTTNTVSTTNSINYSWTMYYQ